MALIPPLSAFPYPEGLRSGGGFVELSGGTSLLPEESKPYWQGVELRGDILFNVSPWFFAGDSILYKHVKFPKDTSGRLSSHRHSYETLSRI
jgi:hypothetical protein